MEPVTLLRAAMIPWSKNSVYFPIFRLPYRLRYHGPQGYSLDELTAFEKELSHLPAFKYGYSSHKDNHFIWAHRSLARLSYENVSGNHEAFKEDYMMYACFDNSVGLPPNESFKSLVESRVTVYGDAFIFKMESDVGNAPRPAKYVHMDQFFIESAQKGGVHAKLILQRLLESGMKEYNNSRPAAQGSLG